MSQPAPDLPGHPPAGETPSPPPGWQPPGALAGSPAWHPPSQAGWQPAGAAPPGPPLPGLPPPGGHPPGPQPGPQPAIPPQSRLWPQLAWEGGLLVLVVIVVAIAAVRVPLFDGPGLWWQLGAVGLLATGLAWSLRTGTPNLAVSGLAGLAAASYAWFVGEASLPPVAAAAVVLVIMAVVGLVLGLAAGLGSLPAWALSLAALVIAQALALVIVGSPGRPAEPLIDAAGFWAGLFVICSLGGGVLLALPPVRRWSGDRLGRLRAADPVRFDPVRVLAAVAGFVGSTLLATLAGLAYVSQLRFAAADFTVSNLILALAAVLFGGVSVYGGRGGITGTVLGTTLVATLVVWLVWEGAQPWAAMLVAGGMILLGLGVGRGLAALTGIGAGLGKGMVARATSPILKPAAGGSDR